MFVCVFEGTNGKKEGEMKGGGGGGEGRKAHVRLQIQAQQAIKARRSSVHTNRIHGLHIPRPFRVPLRRKCPTLRDQPITSLHQLPCLLIHRLRHRLDPVRIPHHHLREARQLALDIHAAIINPQRAQLDLHGRRHPRHRHLVLSSCNARILRRYVRRARGAKEARVRVRPEVQPRRGAGRRRGGCLVRELLQPDLRKRPHLRGHLGRSVGRMRGIAQAAHAGDGGARVDDHALRTVRGRREDILRDVKEAVDYTAARVAVPGLYGGVDVEHVAVCIEGEGVARRRVAVGADGAGEAAAAVEEAGRGPSGKPERGGCGGGVVGGGEVPVEEGGVVGLGGGEDGEGDIACVGGRVGAECVGLVGKRGAGEDSGRERGCVLGLGDEGLGEGEGKEAQSGEERAGDREHLEVWRCWVSRECEDGGWHQPALMQKHHTYISVKVTVTIVNAFMAIVATAYANRRCSGCGSSQSLRPIHCTTTHQPRKASIWRKAQ